LGREVDDDVRLFAIEQFQQKIEFIGYMVNVITVSRMLIDPKRERGRAQRIATDSYD